MQNITEHLQNPDINEEEVTRFRSNSYTELFFAILFTAVMIWSGFALLNPATLPIKQVRIEGDFKYLTTDGMEELIRKKAKGGFFNIDVTAIRNAILADPWVRDVTVHRIWPDKLQVYITEQVAVCRWNDNGLLNRTGQLFTPSKNTIPQDLPKLSGPGQSLSYMFENYNYLDRVLENTPLELSELVLNERRSWKFITTEGLVVILGREDFNIRMNRFVDLVPSILGNRINEAERIDMRYPNGFAVRWKKPVKLSG